MVGGGEVLGDGHGHAGTIREPPHRLHQTFAKGLLTYQERTVVLLKSAGENLAGAGGAFIHQHHQGLGGDRLSRGPLHILNAVASLGGNDHPFIKPLTRDLHAGHKQSTGVAAQIQHVALHPLGLQILKGSTHIGCGIGIELLKADVAQLLAIRAGVHLVLNSVELN